MHHHHSSSSQSLKSPSSPSPGTSSRSSTASINPPPLNTAHSHPSSNFRPPPPPPNPGSRPSANPANQISIDLNPPPPPPKPPAALISHPPPIFTSQDYQATRFSDPSHQLSVPVPPSSSLPTHLGSWGGGHLDPLSFGSVPSSPILGIDLSTNSHVGPASDQLHHLPPPQPFSRPFPSLLQRPPPLCSLHHDHPLTNLNLVNRPLSPSNPTFQSNSQLSHLSNFPQHALQAHPSLEPHLRPHLPSAQSSLPSRSSSSSMLSSLLTSQCLPGVSSSFSNPNSPATDGLSRASTSEPESYASLLHSPISETLGRPPFLRAHALNWDPAGLAPLENRPQPVRQLAEDAIYVARGPSGHPTYKLSSEWSNSTPPSSDHLPWTLRDSTSILGSPSSATHSPSSPFSSWSSLTPADEGAMYGCRSTPALRSRDNLAARLWQIYGPGDQRSPTNDTLESLVRRLTGLGLDADQIRQRLNSHDWKDSLIQKDVAGPGWAIASSVANEPPAQNHPTASESRSSTGQNNSANNVSTTHARLSKINENPQEPCSKVEAPKHSLVSREPSHERGRNLCPTRRSGCNLAGRWQETHHFNPNSIASEMDWSAQSRSRSRPQDGNCMDWRQASRSRSRRQEFRNDSMMPAQSSDQVSNSSNTNIPQGHKSSHESCQCHLINLSSELDNIQHTSNSYRADEITNTAPYQHGLIEQLFGSYHAQQSEENRLQSLSEKDSDHLSLQSSGPSTLSHGLFPSSSIPLSEYEFDPWHLPIKPSQHSLLGSVPGLTQDFANLANAHAEYGYIPRLVRKTSFDEILAQQHHQKRGLNSMERSLSRLQNLGCSTPESLARPNTATDTRDRLNLCANHMGKENGQQDPACLSAESNTQADYFELLSSTLTHTDFNALGSKSHFQPSRCNRNPTSSDDMSFRSSDDLLQPIFDTDSTSFVDRITPYDILNQLNQLDKTPVAHDAHSQWLQDSVAPTAVQPTRGDTANNTEGNHLTRSPSNSSSSSEVSSKSSAAPHLDTGNGEQRVKKEDVVEQVQTNLSFSGGRCSHISSIGEARKRTKQLPYSSSDAPNSINAITSSLNGGQPRGNTHCLNCQTTETPLWRRDSEGRPLCNACGLFVNLHGTPRPAALSKGVIKRRNRGKNREKNVNTPTPVKPQTYSKNLNVGGAQRPANKNFSNDPSGSNADVAHGALSAS